MGIVEEVRCLLQEAAARSRARLPPGIGEDEIRQFEARTGLVVPSQLREWLAITNGPPIGEWFYGIRPKKQFLDIERMLKVYPVWKTEGWIPVSGDGCGDFYVLTTLPKDGPGNPVLFIDNHEDEDRPKYVVASDLWHFLRFLLDDFLHKKPDADAACWPLCKEYVLERDPLLTDYRTWPRAWDLGPGSV